MTEAAVSEYCEKGIDDKKNQDSAVSRLEGEGR